MSFILQTLSPRPVMDILPFPIHNMVFRKLLRRYYYQRRDLQAFHPTKRFNEVADEEQFILKDEELVETDILTLICCCVINEKEASKRHKG